ncbi:hypothetical protein ACLI09_06535 [Flavobacterium sp. RHBU_24]|uniref:hypothetical protein n=1 Tax=Flavobacterium sp. RHBU_24 TaxID=3391185 RepID=UPI003984FB11
MDTSAIRQNLIDKIKTSLPDNVVMDMARLVEINEDEDLTVVFTDEQQARINRSLRDYKEGRYVSGEVAENDIQEWLKD